MFALRDSSNILYHQYLKSGTSSLDEVSPLTEDAAFEASDEPTRRSAFHWDLQSTCQPLYPAFHYISQQLARQGLQIALIVSDQDPFALPIWQLPRRSQILLTRTVRKACIRYSVNPSWMTALASLECSEDLSRKFEAHRPDAYIIRRSILQNEVIFSSEGLILLSIDHIYTLKQLLCTLSKERWVSHSRPVCLASCSHLLNRIHSIHQGVKFTRGYLERVYREIPFHGAAFDEVNAEYDATFCTASIRNIASSPRDLQVFEGESPEPPPPERAELPTRRSPESAAETVSPFTDLDLGPVSSWAAAAPDLEPASAQSAHVVRSLPVTYPLVHQPSSSVAPAQEAEIWYRSLAWSPASTAELWGPDTPPSPLRVVKHEDTGLGKEQEKDGREDEGQEDDGSEEDESGWQQVYALELLEEEIESQMKREGERLQAEDDEGDRQKEGLEPLSHIDVQAWRRDVQEVVCSRCYDTIEAPRRYTLCY